MASHRSSAWRRAALRDHVRSSIQSGALGPGAKLDSLRSLSVTFGLSPPTVLAELRPLIAEGALVTVPGTGIYVADHAPRTRPVFLLVHPGWVRAAEDHHLRTLRLGFEETMSELGGATLSIGRDDLPELVRHGSPTIAGVVSWLRFDDEEGRMLRDLLPGPHVRVGQFREADERDGFDTVSLDDRAGGRLGTEHLLRQGCTRIAHLALHPEHDWPATFRFSRERLVGWRDTLQAAGRPYEGLAFHPERAVDGYHDAVQAASATAERMVDRRDDFDAVLASDDNAVLAFAEAWNRRAHPAEGMPAIIGFEDVAAARRYVTSSIIPQWRELGEHAAHLLWGRHTGTLTTPPEHRRATMRFVARITAGQDWVGVREWMATP